MIKYGCMALAMAYSLAAPAVHAQGSFFVAGQTGRATYGDSEFDDNSANTHALSGGYRWQAGTVTQVGVEVGVGKVGEIGQGYSNALETAHVGVDTTYRHVGANARFSFGGDSRWFAVARAGYMRYEQTLRSSYYTLYIGQTQSDSYRDSGSGAYFGAGVGVDVSKNISINVMFNGYGFSDFDTEGFYAGPGAHDIAIGTASTTTLGVEARF